MTSALKITETEKSLIVEIINSNKEVERLFRVKFIRGASLRHLENDKWSLDISVKDDLINFNNTVLNEIEEIRRIKKEKFKVLSYDKKIKFIYVRVPFDYKDFFKKEFSSSERKWESDSKTWKMPISLKDRLDAFNVKLSSEVFEEEQRKKQAKDKEFYSMLADMKKNKELEQQEKEAEEKLSKDARALENEDVLKSLKEAEASVEKEYLRKKEEIGNRINFLEIKEASDLINRMKRRSLGEKEENRKIFNSDQYKLSLIEENLSKNSLFSEIIHEAVSAKFWRTAEGDRDNFCDIKNNVRDIVISLKHSE